MYNDEQVVHRTNVCHTNFGQDDTYDDFKQGQE